MGKVITVVVVCDANKVADKNSMSVMYGVDNDGSLECWCILFSMIFSKGCGGKGYNILIIFSMTSRAVSVLDQNKGGIYDQPI